ncbi:Guanine nucleotide exchange protein smcr8b [Bagarius yarrelli]|uniref:Guanine nucleotide exchange protein smcr8b n=1 Tax=Bagarius yarrelli TaxID=175774 RepID=A0A556VAS0_BAGYA|nr:Guanine nucleotide exchange protein smcr8b [Bagarius yarrelli]
MIGSPDLLAFTTEAEFLEPSTESLELPADLSVPLYPRSQDASPWSRNVRFDKDFILISEFSEQVGPQPLLTIPEDAKTCGMFDLNHFSLRIIGAGQSGEGAYAYVHHLTLYDLEARGFVRPFCLVYVSSEEEKIMHHFRQLSAEFTKASECLKTGNRKNFAIEVDKKLSDLEYTKLILLREINRKRLSEVKAGERNGMETKDNRNTELLLTTKKEELKEKQRCRVSFREADRNDSMPEINRKGNEPDFDPNGMNHHNKHNRSEKVRTAQSASGQSIMWACKADELTRVENVIQEHRSLLKQISSYPNRKLGDPQFLPYESDDVYHSLESDLDPIMLYSQSPGSVGERSGCSHTPSHTPTLVSLSRSRQFDMRLKSLDELCDKYFLQQAQNQLRSIERRFRGDNSYLLSRQQTQNLLSHLESTNFLFEDLCDLEKETGQQLSRPQSAPPLPLSPLQSEPVSLDSYTSCVEMVPIRLELHRNGPESVPTSPCDELPMAPNFLNGGDCRTEDVSLPMKDSISSEESIEVLGTEKSIRTQAPADIMETVSQRPVVFPGTRFEGQKRKVVTRRENSEDSIEVLSVTDSIIPDDLRASCPSAIFEETPENEGEENADPECCPEDVQCREYQHSATTPTIVINSSDNRMSLDSCTVSACSPLCETGFLQDRRFRFTPDNFSDCTSYLSLGSTGSTLSVDFHGEKRAAGSRRKRSRLGRAALNFLRQFPFAVHAMYSLLIGRTVVVLGREERAVRRLVTALTVYTPHLQWCRGNIQPWTSNPLQITDLQTWKLIGYNRSAFPPSPSVPPCLLRFSRYLSLLDIDQKTLRCPVYKGSLICPLMEARTYSMRGTTYFLYAQSLISQLVSRAFLLAFSHKLRHPSNPEAEVTPQHVFGEFHDDDLKILQYLSELITQNMTGTSGTCLQFSYAANTVFKI